MGRTNRNAQPAAITCIGVVAHFTPFEVAGMEIAARHTFAAMDTGVHIGHSDIVGMGNQLALVVVEQ